MMNIWGMTDIGLVRNENQDAYVVRFNEETGHLICVVCDGMGGPRGGRLASALASETFLASCFANLQRGMSAHEVQKVASFAVTAANNAVYERSKDHPELRGMGTTLVSAIVWDDCALLSNVGDSRAYLIRCTGEVAEGESRIARITRDHSLVERLVELGNITEEEARSHPDRNLITRALGPDASTESDTYFVQLQQGDAILLCTDGLIETVMDEEMEREILLTGDDHGCLNRLLDISKSRGASDNVTAVLMRQR